MLYGEKGIGYMPSWTFEAIPAEIPGIIQTVEQNLVKWNAEQKTRAKTLLAVEESLARLIGHSADRPGYDSAAAACAGGGHRTDHGHLCAGGYA